MLTEIVLAADADVVGTLFSPMQSLFTTAVVPAVAVATVAVLGLRIGIKWARAAFSR